MFISHVRNLLNNLGGGEGRPATPRKKKSDWEKDTAVGVKGRDALGVINKDHL